MREEALHHWEILLADAKDKLVDYICIHIQHTPVRLHSNQYVGDTGRLREARPSSSSSSSSPDTSGVSGRRSRDRERERDRRRSDGEEEEVRRRRERPRILKGSGVLCHIDNPSSSASAQRTISMQARTHPLHSTPLTEHDECRDRDGCLCANGLEAVDLKKVGNEKENPPTTACNTTHARTHQHDALIVVVHRFRVGAHFLIQ